MLPFQEEQLKKAAESILQYTEVLSATYDGLRSDLLVASVWYCLKEEQKKVHRLEEALKIQSTEPQKKTSEPLKQVVTPSKTITSTAKTVLTPGTNGSYSVSKNQVVSPSKPSNNKTETKGIKDSAKSKASTVNKGKISTIDQDVCVIEIDDDDEEDEKTKPSSKKENKTETKISKQKESETPKVKSPEPTKGILSNQKAARGPGRPPKTLPAPVKTKKDLDKQVEKDKPKKVTKHVEETIILDEEDDIVEQDTGNHGSSSDHEMFDMDCDEIQDETVRKVSVNKTPYKIIEPSEKAKASSILTETEPKESEEKEKEETQESPRTRSKAKSKKGNKPNDEKNAKDSKKSEDQIENINVIFEESDEEDSTDAVDSKVLKETIPDKQPENTENDKTKKNKENEEQLPFPLTLTQNIAGQSDAAVAETSQNEINQIDSNVTQQFTTVITGQYTELTQPAENSSVVSVSATANGQFIDPGANTMEKMVDNRQQYIQQPMNDTGIPLEVKRETEVDVDDAVHGISPAQVQGLMPVQGMHGMIGHQDMGIPPHLAAGQGIVQGMLPPQGMHPSGVQGMDPLQGLQGMVPPGQGPHPPPGFMYNPTVHHQGPPGFVDAQFQRQQFLPPNSNPVSLSSLTSGALTYPYRSTESTPGLYGPRQPGMMPGPPGYMDPALQQQLGLQQMPAPDIPTQGRKRGKPGENISPPTKKRLLDFDRKWHEGPSSSKGQERYIAPPSNASKSGQSSWEEGPSRITEMEWAMRFNSYQSISNHVPPEFVGTSVSQDIVQTEVVGVSLDDVGYHGQVADDVGYHRQVADDVENNTVEKGSEKPKRGGFRGRGRRGRGSLRGRGTASRGGGTSGKNQSEKDSAGGKGKALSSPGSPQKSGAFSFFKRGRVKAVVRGRGQGRGRGARGRGAGAGENPQGAKQARGRPFKVVKRGRGAKTRPKS